MPHPFRRHHHPARPKFRRARATLILLGLTWLSYFLLEILPEPATTDSLALSARGLRRGFFWEIFTHLFVHASFWHLLFNSILLYFSGRALERMVGVRRFLIVFFVGGLFGGAAEYLRDVATTGNSLIMGNSAAIAAVILAIATLRPRSEAVLLLFFVIPIRLRVAIFGGVIMLFSLVMALVNPTDSFGHLGHFAGALSGLLLGFLMRVSRQQEAVSRQQRMHDQRIAPITRPSIAKKGRTIPVRKAWETPTESPEPDHQDR